LLRRAEREKSYKKVCLACRKGTLLAVRLAGRFACCDIGMAVQAAADGLGIAFLPDVPAVKALRYLE
jgi:hypothetical protein